MDWALSSEIPFALTLAYSAFMVVLVPVYLRHYGPANFLYFCDIALLLTLAGLWLQSPLLLSVATVGILVPQLFWLFDFIANLLGRRVSGMTDYMLDSRRSLLLRGLSLFHGWLPIMLLYALAHSGYDARALPIWTLLSSVLIFVCYRYIAPPSAGHGIRPVNINYVYGFSDVLPQRWMSQRAWLALLFIGLPLLVYLPSHLLLRYLYAAA